MNSASKVLTIISVFTTALLTTPVPANAGWILTEEDGSKTVISEGKIKNVPGEGDEVASVMDTNTNTILIFNSRLHTYAVGSMNEMCAEVKALQDKAMENMTPEDRKMMEQMASEGAKGAAPKVSIGKSGKGGNMSGYETEKYAVTVDGAPYGEIWIATDAALLKDLGAQRDKMAKMGSEMSSCMSMGMDTQGVEDSPEYMALEKKGIITKETVGEDVMTHIVSIEKANVPDSEFQTPNGYKKVPFAELMMAPEE